MLRRDIVTKIPIFQEVKDEATLSVLEENLKAAFVGDGACITISEFDVVGSEAIFNRADKFVIQTGAEGETDVSLTWQSIKVTAKLLVLLTLIRCCQFLLAQWLMGM